MHSLLKEKLPHFDTKYVFNYYGVPMRYSSHKWKLLNAEQAINKIRTHNINTYPPIPLQEVDGIMEKMLKSAVHQIQQKYVKLPVEATLFPLSLLTAK